MITDEQLLKIWGCDDIGLEDTWGDVRERLLEKLRTPRMLAVARFDPWFKEETRDDGQV